MSSGAPSRVIPTTRGLPVAHRSRVGVCSPLWRTPSTPGATPHPMWVGMAETEYDYTQRVATLQPNACGFYDMSGNVWEYTEDDYVELLPDHPAHQSPRGDLLAPGLGSRGCANSGTSTLRVSDQYSISRVDTSGYLGFRLARTAP